MKRLCFVTLLLALAGVPDGLAEEPRGDIRPQDATALTLGRVYQDYQALKAAPAVAGLVRLDRQLRDLMPGYTWGDRHFLSAAYLDPRYKDLGVAPGLFDRDHLEYSGKLLAEAHALNPRSPLRSHTLYSTIFSPEGESSNKVPSRDRAEEYAREFPAGPFVVEALTVAARFYDDLFKVIKLEETGGRIGYKYECFVPYLTARPLAEQRRAAQEAGVRTYERLIALRPTIHEIRDAQSALRKGTTIAWHSCAD